MCSNPSSAHAVCCSISIPLEHGDLHGGGAEGAHCPHKGRAAAGREGAPDHSLEALQEPLVHARGPGGARWSVSEYPGRRGRAGGAILQCPRARRWSPSSRHCCHHNAPLATPSATPWKGPSPLGRWGPRPTARGRVRYTRCTAGRRPSSLAVGAWPRPHVLMSRRGGAARRRAPRQHVLLGVPNGARVPLGCPPRRPAR